MKDKNRLFVLIALFQVGLMILGLLAIAGVVVLANIDRAQRAARLTPTPATPVTTPATPTFTPTATPSPTNTSEPTATPTRVVRETLAPTADETAIAPGADETATPAPRPDENLLTAVESDDTVLLSLENKVDLGELTLDYPDQLAMHEAGVVNLVLAVDPQLASLPPVAIPRPSIKGRIRCSESGLKYSDTVDLFPVTRATISAPDFEIYDQTHAEQHILADPDTPTIWSWIVVPGKAGLQTITLHISVAFRFTNATDPCDYHDLIESVSIERDIDVTAPTPARN